jgi:hypothetical protein
MLLRRKTLLESRRPGVISKWYWDRIGEEFRGNGWVVLRSGKCPGGGFDFEKIAKESSDVSLEGLTEWYLDRPTARRDEMAPADNLSPIAKAWAEIVGDPIIPFDLNERREKFRSAFERLADYIKEHEDEQQRKLASEGP